MLEITGKHFWYGPQSVAAVGRAAGRGAVAIGMHVVSYGKENAHVISGTLRRSIHLAKVGYEGTGDLDAAETRDLMLLDTGTAMADLVTSDSKGHHLEAGSWLPYACVEEVGRGHFFMAPAVEAARAHADGIMLQAFREENLL